MDPNSKIIVSEDVVARVVGGEAILLNLSTGTYFGLNPVGSRVWELLEEEDLSLAKVCEQIADEFSAPLDVVTDDITALIGSLKQNDLLELAAS